MHPLWVSLDFVHEDDAGSKRQRAIDEQSDGASVAKLPRYRRGRNFEHYAVRLAGRTAEARFGGHGDGRGRARGLESCAR